MMKRSQPIGQLKLLKSFFHRVSANKPGAEPGSAIFSVDRTILLLLSIILGETINILKN